MWYVLECEERSCFIYGFKHSISKGEFAERIENNTLMEIVNKVPVNKGDVFPIQLYL